MSGPAADVRELRSRIRSWRRGRARLAWGEVVSEAYTVVLAVLVLGSMLVSAVVHAGDTVAACTSAACHGARTSTPLLVLLAWLAAAAALVALLGPVVASRATSAVVLSTPVDRAGWLRRQYLAGVLVTAVVGATLLLLVGVVAGWPWHTAGVLAAVTGVAGALLYATGVVAQAERPTWWRVAVASPAVLLVAALVAVAVDGFEGVHPPRLPHWWLLPVALAVPTVAVGVAGGRRLGRLRRRELVRGHGLAQGLAGALSGLDPALAYDVVLEQAAARRAFVRPVRGGVRGPAAMVGADLVRLRRSPVRLVALVGALAVPYALAGAGAGSLVVPLAVIVAFLAALPLGAGVRVLARTPGIGRLLGHPPVRLRAAALAVPAAALLLFGLATVPALPGRPGDALALGVAVGTGACAALARWLMAAPPDYSRPLVSTPMGGVPTNLYGSITRGFDIALLVSIPVLFAPGAVGALVSVGLSAVVLAVLVGKR